MENVEFTFGKGVGRKADDEFGLARKCGKKSNDTIENMVYLSFNFLKIA